MSSRLDDKEQQEWLQKWETNRRKCQLEIKAIRKAHADGAISLMKMEVLIWKTKRKYRV